MPEIKALLRARKKQKATDDVVEVDRATWNERRLAEATPHGVKLIEDEGLKYPDPASRKAGRRKGTRGGAGGRLLKFVCSCEPEAFIVRCYKPELMALCLTCKAPFRLDESSIPESSTLLRGKQGKHESKADLLKVMREEGLTLAVKKEPPAPFKAKKWVDALKEALEKVQSEIRHAKDLNPDYDPQEDREPIEPLDDTDYDPQMPPMDTAEYEWAVQEGKAEERKAKSEARIAKKVEKEVEQLRTRSEFFGVPIKPHEIEAIKEMASAPVKRMSAKRAKAISARIAKKKSPMTGKDRALLRKVEAYYEGRDKRADARAKRMVRKARGRKT